jgi:hypothetical protein
MDLPRHPERERERTPLVGMSSASGKAYEEALRPAQAAARVPQEDSADEQQSSSTAVSASLFSATRRRLARRGDREHQPVHRGLAHPEVRRREDDQSSDDRPRRGDAAQEDDRGRLRMGADRAQHQPERYSADHPGAGVEDGSALSVRARMFGSSCL